MTKELMKFLKEKNITIEGDFTIKINGEEVPTSEFSSFALGSLYASPEEIDITKIEFIEDYDWVVDGIKVSLEDEDHELLFNRVTENYKTKSSNIQQLLYTEENITDYAQYIRDLMEEDFLLYNEELHTLVLELGYTGFKRKVKVENKLDNLFFKLMQTERDS